MRAGRFRRTRGGAIRGRPVESAPRGLYEGVVRAQRSGRQPFSAGRNSAQATSEESARDWEAQAARKWCAGPPPSSRQPTRMRSSRDHRSRNRAGIRVWLGRRNHPACRDRFRRFRARRRRQARLARAGAARGSATREAHSISAGARSKQSSKPKKRVARKRLFRSASSNGTRPATGTRCSITSRKIPTMYFRKHFRWWRSSPSAATKSRARFCPPPRSRSRSSPPAWSINSDGATAKFPSRRWAACTGARSISTPRSTRS